jgi:hypothetical protein
VRAGSSPKKLDNSLNSFATSYYGIRLNIRRIDKTSNKTVYEKTRQEPITQTIQRRQLLFIEQCLRRDTEELTSKYVLYKPKHSHGKRNRDRPRIQYPDYIEKMLNEESPSSNDEIGESAANMTNWFKIVVAYKPRLFAAD